MSAHDPDDTQPDLFGAPPRPAPARELQIAARRGVPLGKEALAFNKLIRKVEALRQKLAEWTDFEPRHHQRVVNELLPLQQKFGAPRRAMILTVATILAGKAHGGPGGKTERRNLKDFLLDLLQAQLAEQPDDAELVALHDEHADISFAEDRELERELARQVAEQFLGVELDDEELGETMEDVFAAGMAKARAADAQRAETASARRAQGAKKSASAEAKAAAAEKAAQEVSQSVREVYRKLASALHPDRAADEEDRARRHALMQRVNHAYDKHDLLTLLTLQLETEQIDAGHLAQVSKQRLGHYNKVLREQVKELEQEIAAIAGHFRMLLPGMGFRLTPADVQHALTRDIAGTREEIRDLEAHHAMLMHAGSRKLWLKDYARERREDERMEAAMQEALARGTKPFGDDEWFDPFGGTGTDPFGAPPSRPSARRKSRKRRR